DYSALKVNVVSNDRVEVSVTLTNTGKVKGKEVAQLYLRDEYASVTRPVRELKGFEIAELNPNESKTITFVLTKAELGFYDNSGEFIVEPGNFKVFVGGSSTATLEAKFELK